MYIRHPIGPENVDTREMRNPVMTNKTSPTERGMEDPL